MIESPLDVNMLTSDDLMQAFTNFYEDWADTGFKDDHPYAIMQNAALGDYERNRFKILNDAQYLWMEKLFKNEKLKPTPKEIIEQLILCVDTTKGESYILLKDIEKSMGNLCTKSIINNLKKLEDRNIIKINKFQAPKKKRGECNRNVYVLIGFPND